MVAALRWIHANSLLASRLDDADSDSEHVPELLRPACGQSLTCPRTSSAFPAWLQRDRSHSGHGMSMRKRIWNGRNEAWLRAFIGFNVSSVRPMQGDDEQAG